jgi:hypothetical protein
MTSQFALPPDGSAASNYGFTPGTTAAMIALQNAAPTGLVAGRSIYYNTDWSVLMMWNGSRFIPMNADKRVRLLFTTAVAGQSAQPGNTTAVALAGTKVTFIPGLVKVGDQITWRSMASKLGGAVETATFHLRMGGGDSVSDQTFSGGGHTLVAANTVTTQVRSLRVESNTTVRLIGSPGYTAVSETISGSSTVQTVFETVNNGGNFASANVYMQWWSAMSVGTGGEYLTMFHHEVNLTMA